MSSESVIRASLRICNQMSLVVGIAQVED